MNEKPLFNHQKEAVNFILSRSGRAALFHEIGLGKTRTALEVFTRLRTVTPGLRLMVVCPMSLIEGAWGRDIEEFTLYKYRNLRHRGLPKPLEPFIEDICLINYESFVRPKMLKDIYYLVKRCESWMIVLDESSRLKNHRSLTTKAMLRVAGWFRYRLVMSGTPAPNSELEYWGQMEFVEPGSADTSFTRFRNTFFALRNRYSGKVLIQQGGSFMTRQLMRQAFREGYEYGLMPAKRDQLMSILQKKCHIAKKKDCLDLPEQLDEVRMVDLGPKQTIVYWEMHRHLVTEIEGSVIAAPVALAKIMKLRQVVGGFAYDDNADPHPIADAKKLEELLNVIEEAGKQQIIIWCEFHWEIIKVCHELYSKYGEGSVVALHGATEDKDGSIEAFRSGRARFLVAHPKSAGHGLTFVNCSLEVFYSLSYSWELYEQCRGRIHRAGQKKPCTYVHLIAKGTIDEMILEALRKKEGTQEMVERFLKKYKK